jgi:hypothetical protein
MFTQESENRISAGLFCLFWGALIIGLFFPNISAQESITVSQENLSEGILIAVEGAEFGSVGNYLVIGDSAKQALALRQVSLDGTLLWMKKSDETVEFPNVIHWSEDEESATLAIDLSGVRDRITAQSTLQVVIVPLVSDASQLFISFSRASDRAGVESGDLQKIKDVNVEINIEG